MSSRAAAWRLGVCCALLAAAPARAQTSVEARLDSVVASFLPGRFAGAVRVERGGKVLLDRGYGFADREHEVANTPATVFAIGSVTKQFTAAAILLLAEDGRLRTSDPVTRWFPDAHPAWDSVTVRQLLSHTGGIPDAEDESQLAPRDGKSGAAERLVRRFGKRPPEFPPGSRYAYSSGGYLLLGRIVELASGDSFEGFVTRRILRPLGLTDTHFAGEDSSGRAHGYLSRRGVVQPPPVADLRAYAAAGGLWSTTADQLRWQRALLGGKLLKPASLAEMITAVKGDYGYGIHHRTQGGREAYYHSGRVNGFESLLGWYAADSVAVVVLENLDGGVVDQVFNGLALAALPPQRKPEDTGR